MWENIDSMKIHVPQSNEGLCNRIKFLHDEIEKLTYQIYQHSVELKRCNQCFPRN